MVQSTIDPITWWAEHTTGAKRLKTMRKAGVQESLGCPLLFCSPLPVKGAQYIYEIQKARDNFEPPILPTAIKPETVCIPPHPLKSLVPI
jgi:hypothetical protein